MPAPTVSGNCDTLVVGIAVVDAVARPVDASPAPGGLRFFDELTFTTGGNALNVSVALAKLGVPVDLVARVGTDPLGDFVIRELERHVVSSAHVARDHHRSTSFSFVSVPTSGERSFLHTTGANATLSSTDVPPLLFAGKRFALITGTMLMDTLDGDQTVELLRAAHAAGAQTLLDTVFVEGVPHNEWRRRVLPALPVLDYFIPSEAEARAITNEDDPRSMACSLQRAGAANVIIKLGARGVFCLDTSGAQTLVPSFNVTPVVDTTGAGDCWAAGFLFGLRDHQPIEHAARFANAVAALSTRALGATTALRGMDQVMELLSE